MDKEITEMKELEEIVEIQRNLERNWKSKRNNQHRKIFIKLKKNTI